MQSPLRKLRKSHGFTLSHVASGVQVDPATLSRIERCEQVPSVELTLFIHTPSGRTSAALLKISSTNDQMRTCIRFRLISMPIPLMRPLRLLKPCVMRLR